MVNLFRKALIAGGLVAMLGCGDDSNICEKYSLQGKYFWLHCEISNDAPLTDACEGTAHNHGFPELEIQYTSANSNLYLDRWVGDKTTEDITITIIEDLKEEQVATPEDCGFNQDTSSPNYISPEKWNCYKEQSNCLINDPNLYFLTVASPNYDRLGDLICPVEATFGEVVLEKITYLSGFVIGDRPLTNNQDENHCGDIVDDLTSSCEEQYNCNGL